MISISIIVKILAIFLGLMVISKSYHDYQKKRESLAMFLFWTIIWVAIMVFAIKPILVIKIIRWSGNRKMGIGTFLGMASVFLFYVTYRIYHKANLLEQRFRDLITKLAIIDFGKKR